MEAGFHHPPQASSPREAKAPARPIALEPGVRLEAKDNETVIRIIIEVDASFSEKPLHMEPSNNIIDHLTGLGNLSHFYIKGEQELAFAKRHTKRMAVILIHFDGFAVHQNQICGLSAAAKIEHNK
jgi:GGDEF domain-containing protein